MPGVLQHSPADVVRSLLLELELGFDYADDATSWAVFTDGEPDLPDNCITVYGTQGRDEGSEMVQGERAEHHGVQIRIRSKTHTQGYVKARDIASAMDRNSHFINLVLEDIGYLVWKVTRTTDVLPLGKDAPNSKRNLFTINAVVSVRCLVDVGFPLLTEDGQNILRELGDGILLDMG